MIVFYFVMKENPEISFWNGPELETTSLTDVTEVVRITNAVARKIQVCEFILLHDCTICSKKLREFDITKH